MSEYLNRYYNKNKMLPDLPHVYFLRLQHGPVDVYGNCGTFTCPRNDSAKCNQIIRDDYMFYLAFENSADQDYVTEKIMTAYQNDAVPVVLGNADYERYVSILT